MNLRHLAASVILLAAFCVHLSHAAVDDSILGSWKVLAYDQNGHAPPEEILAKMRVVIQGNKIIFKPKLIAQYKSAFGKKEATFSLDDTRSDEITFKLDKDKGWIDLIPMGDVKAIKGLFVRDGDALKICFPQADKKRPKKMPEQPKAGMVRMVLKPQGLAAKKP